jgi:DNA polymerase-3 subunit delta
VRIYPEKLAQHLEKSPSAIYWIAGDDPLLVQEACDTIRTASLKQGFAERKVFHPEKIEHWHDAFAEANAMSLFADKALIDIRVSAGKIEHELLLEYLKRPNPDSMILLRTDKVESASQKTQWFKAMEQACTFVPVTSLDISRFPQWLAERARRKQANLSPEALQTLATHTEGNLLAAVQELDKLILQFGNASITPAQVEASVGDSSHYDVFALNDAMLAGNTTQALKILTSLKMEGTNALNVIGALSRELRQLATAAEDIANGIALPTAMRQLGVWEKRQAVFTKALQRLNAATTREVIKLMAEVDQGVKGMARRDPWDALESLCLLVCRGR